MKKKLFTILLSLIFIMQTGLMMTSFASSDCISVNVNGNTLNFDQEPVIQNDRVLVPLRSICESLGLSVGWDAKNQTITATNGLDSLLLQIANNTMLKNNNAIELDTAPTILNDRTLVPVRAISEGCGANVNWNPSDKTVSVNTGEETKGNSSDNSNKTNINSILNGIDLGKLGNIKDCDLTTDLGSLEDLLGIGKGNANNGGSGGGSAPAPTPAPTPTPTPSPKPDTTPRPDTPSDSPTSNYEAKVFELVNKVRAENGLAALTWNEGLAEVARAHSKDMSIRNFFSHNNPDGQSPFDRMKSYGLSYSRAAENIAAGQATPEEVMNGWMNSPGHRANILDANLKELGVGYYKGNGSYKTYWTQNFMTR